MFRRGLFYSFLSVYLRHFLGLSVTETTLFATLPMVVNIVFQTFVWGGLSDRYQLRRTMIIVGEITAAFGTVLVWYWHRSVPDLILAGYVIIIGLSVIEIFWSMSNVGWSALISDIYRKEQRTAVQGRLASVGGIGRLGGVWIGGVLYDGFPFRYAGWGFHEGWLFFISSAVMLLSVIPMLFVPEGGIHLRNETSSDPSARSGAVSSERIFFVFLLAMTFINFGRNSIALILTQYLVLDTGFAVSSKALSYIVNAQSAAIIVFGLLAGRIGSRWGDGNALLAGTVAAVFSLLLIAFTDRIVWVVVSNLLRGASDAILLSAAYAFASVLIPPLQRAKRFGAFNATFFLSWGVGGTLIAGPVVDALMAAGQTEVFAYRMSFLSAAALTAVGLVILLALMFRILPESTLQRVQQSGPQDAADTRG